MLKIAKMIQPFFQAIKTFLQDPEAEATHLQAFPQSSLAFHWPRLDRDQLLCIRLFVNIHLHSI